VHERDTLALLDALFGRLGEQAVEGAIFGDEMAQVREKGRITVVPLDVAYPVNTFWDFGLGRRNPIWLHQRIGLARVCTSSTST
jgi:hypothetical protein